MGQIEIIEDQVRKQGVSVIICCHNSAGRIVPTLEHLCVQEVDEDLQWEVILIDNNCSDRTVEVAERTMALSKNDVAFHCFEQPVPGLIHAREKGIEKARYNYLLFVDDDNGLCSNYLQTVFDHLEKDASLGMVGGKGIAITGSTAPNWFNQFGYCFAVGEQGEESDGVAQTDLLYGAGIAMRAELHDLLKANGFVSMLTGRSGKKITSGEDTELALVARMAGYGLGYISTISFKHFIDDSRLNWTYMKRLFFGFGLAKSRLDLYASVMRGDPTPNDGRIPFWLNRVLFLFKKLIPDLPLIVAGVLFRMEGNERLLHAFGKWGQIVGIIQMRSNYIDAHQGVHLLQQRLRRSGEQN